MFSKEVGYLIKRSKGQLWYIFLKKQRLNYLIKQDQSWTRPELMDSCTYKYFVTCLGYDDSIYVLAYTYSKQLLLYIWSNNGWNKIHITSLSSKYEDINYISLKLVLGKLHILYFVNNSLQKARVSLKHYVLDNSVLIPLDSLNFFSDDRVMALNINSDDKGLIYFFYKRQLAKTFYLALSIYRKDKKTWSKEILLASSSRPVKDFDSKIGLGRDLHFLWSEVVDNQVSLYYKRATLEAIINKRAIRSLRLFTISNTIEYLSLSTANEIGVFWMDQSRGFYYLISEEKPDKNNIRVIDYRPVSPYYLALNDKTKNNPILVIGDGFPVFKWNILELIDAKNNRLGKENKILERDNKLIKDLKLRLEKHEQLIEELYKAFENLNNTLKEKDKSIHRLNIKIKQLSFELEQMRSRFADRKFKQEENKNVSIQKKDQSTDQCKSYVIREVGEEEIQIFDDLTGSQEDREEINLGKVSIIINPKNESL